MIHPPGWRLPMRLALAVAGGLIAALGLAPFGLWPLSLLGLAVIPALMEADGRARDSALIGWAFGTGYFALAMAWIVEPFLVDIARHGWMAPFALVFLSIGLALFWAAAFGLAHLSGRSALARVLALAVLWPLAEFARAYLLTGLPWAGLAQVWVDTDVALLLAWIGPQGLGLVTVLAGLGLGLALRHRALPLRLAALVPAVGLGVAALALDPAPADPGPSVVRLVQPNARQDQKWDPAMIPVFFQRQIDFTSAAPRPDLIVWPETALPNLLEDSGPVLEAVADAAAGAAVVVGVQRSDGLRYFNSLLYLDPYGTPSGLYDKHHLVPFGEYIPFGDLAATIGLRGFAAREGDGFSAGPGPRLMSMGQLGRALPLICYEAVFPQHARGPERPDFLIQITNDAWFGAYSGPFQHLAQARMRAIEQGLPMVRVANTGISALIDPWGRIIAQIDLDTAGYVDAALPVPLAPTIYARTGDLAAFLVLCLGFLSLCGYMAFTKQRNSD